VFSSNECMKPVLTAANGNGHSDILGGVDARHAGMKDEVNE